LAALVPAWPSDWVLAISNAISSSWRPPVRGSRAVGYTLMSGAMSSMDEVRVSMSMAIE